MDSWNGAIVGAVFIVLIVAPFVDLISQRVGRWRFNRRRRDADS